MQICAHSVFKNEERYLWFSVMSVLPYVDRIMLWDTGSTDNSVKIAKEIKRKFSKKVDFRELGEIDIYEFTKVRQQMLEETKEDWFLVLDGDEVWFRDNICRLVSQINKNGEKLDSIVVRYKNMVGDIFHYQDEAVGKYKIDNEHGFITIRAINRKIKGLAALKPHGQIGYFKDNVLIQDLPNDRRLFIKGDSYLHFTNLIRSNNELSDNLVPKRQGKYKVELGHEVAYDYYYPEVFFQPRPKFVVNPWVKRDKNYEFRAAFITPIKTMKRKLYAGKVGY
jgi:glycosyltransferase involved in cell wall biosynthesis